MTKPLAVRLAHRHLNERHRIRLAKTMYAAGGWIWAHVKTYSRMYTMDHDEGTGEFTFSPARRRWTGAGWALEWGAIHSEALDPVHYPHWAYQHRRCGVTCGMCGGMACDGEGCGWPPEVKVAEDSIHRRESCLRFGRKREQLSRPDG